MKGTILRLGEVATDPVTGSGTADRNNMINEQVAICMEINSFAGQLPPDLKDKVRRLIELVLQLSAYSNKADRWSQLLLELHGILTGGGTSLYPLSTGNDEKIKEDRTIEENEVELDKNISTGSPPGELPVAGPEDGSEDETPVQKRIKPAKLRLVLPIDDSSEQELDLGSLFIAVDSLPKKGNGCKKVSPNPR
jgi:hypothetical protein